MTQPGYENPEQREQLYDGYLATPDTGSTMSQPIPTPEEVMQGQLETLEEELRFDEQLNSGGDYADDYLFRLVCPLPADRIGWQ